jgi:hypothetical protein
MALSLRSLTLSPLLHAQRRDDDADDPRGTRAFCKNCALCEQQFTHAALEHQVGGIYIKRETGAWTGGEIGAWIEGEIGAWIEGEIGAWIGGLEKGYLGQGIFTRLDRPPPRCKHTTPTH